MDVFFMDLEMVSVFVGGMRNNVNLLIYGDDNKIYLVLKLMLLILL